MEPQHEIFRIATPRAVVIWLLNGDFPRPVAEASAPSHFVVFPRQAAREDITVGKGDDMALIDGARLDDYRLFEQRSYTVLIQAIAGCSVRLTNRDPQLPSVEPHKSMPNVCSGSVNFGSQVGLTRFTLLIDGAPEFELELEVSSTKLDYATDYAQLLADLQGVMTGLVLAYLRTTYQRGLKFPSRRTTELEWVVLLRNAIDPLEHALRFITARPVHGLALAPRWVPASRVRRIDGALRADVLRGRGRGLLQAGARGLAVRGQLRERRPQPTLDTAEHRWLAEQVRRLRRRVSHLLGALDPPGMRAAPDAAPRRDRQIHGELTQLESRLDALAKLAPLAAATAPPPASFASLQLMQAPGYREAYQQCLILGMGLRIEGGALELPVKELSRLYEYWCFVTVVWLLTQMLGLPITASDVIAVREVGLRVLLQAGKDSQIVFAQGERRITVNFNPQLRSHGMLNMQKPDILISLREPGWPTLELVLDAKYRVEAGEDGELGPPPTTVSDLHRYRDAILGERGDNEWADDARPADNRALIVDANDDRARRSVIHAVALFPAKVDPETYRKHRLWQSIERIGIGAIAVLPGQTELLNDWLRGVLTRGGWALTDLAPRHAAIESSRAARIAAAKPVLIAVLRNEAPAEHLAWIREQRQYYVPEHETQDRRYRVDKIAVYVPKGQPETPAHGAVLYVADVLAIRRLARREIATPWLPKRKLDERQVLYRLGPLTSLAQSIANPHDVRMSTPRWSSLLGLGRARELRELLLETEPEWRLLEALRAHGADVGFRPGKPTVVDEYNPIGRTWFVVGDRMLRYGGASGFITRRGNGEQQAFQAITEAFAYLVGAASR